MKVFYAEEEINLRAFTDTHYPQGSFCFAALLRAKDIKVNGVRTGSDLRLKKGDEVVYYTNPRQESVKSHEVVFEDGNVLIADKFSGVDVNALLCELRANGEFYAAHRLDRNTAGLVAFAKNREAENELLRAFRERRAHKEYLALCKNCFKKSSDTLKAFLYKDASGAKVKVSERGGRGAAEIVTEYEVTESFGDVAAVKIKLHTGRTHQIRAHMAFIGCPVLGDMKYGDEALNAKYSATRQRLISVSLGFEFPDGALKYLDKRTWQSGLALNLDSRAGL